MFQPKFIAIYIPTGEFFEPYGIDFNNDTITGNFDGEQDKCCYFSLDGSYGDAVLLSFTGYNDINGRKIYGGALCRHGKHPKVYEVVWDIKLQWSLRSSDEKLFPLQEVYQYVVVIGSTYTR